MSTKIKKLFLLTMALLLVSFSGIGLLNTTNAQGYDDWDFNDYEYDNSYGDYYYETNDPGEVLAAMFIPMFCGCTIGLAFWIYYAISLSKIAEKAGHGDKKMFAWIPVANNYLETQIAGKPAWWLLLYFIPFVNIYVYIVTWMELAKITRHQSWWGILVVVSPVSLIVPGYLAFTEGKEAPYTPPVV